MNQPKTYILLAVLLIASGIVWLGYRDTRHKNLVWATDRPILYTPIFYNRDSLMAYAERAFLQDDPEALAVTGAAAYNLRVFDRPALDSLPAITLDDADMMLLHSAWLGYQPAFTVIQYLHQLGLWHHSLPTRGSAAWARTAIISWTCWRRWASASGSFCR